MRVRPASRFRPRARWVLVVALAFVVVAAVLIVWISGRSSPTTGYDVSYPQCSGSYPSKPLFGIVGVNGGLASNANRCLRGELQWARDAPGQKRPKQPPLSLYIDTGNPGAHHVADWPTGGSTPTYGSCNGLLTNACSYLYGEQRASHSYRLVAALDSVAATAAPWWLDVELTASWAGTYKLNVAALQGFIAGLRNVGATGPIGIYSTGDQWKDITGLTAQTTPTAFTGRLPDWVAGTEATLTQARQACMSAASQGSRRRSRSTGSARLTPTCAAPARTDRCRAEKPDREPDRGLAGELAACTGRPLQLRGDLGDIPRSRCSTRGGS